MINKRILHLFFIDSNIGYSEIQTVADALKSKDYEQVFLYSIWFYCLIHVYYEYYNFPGNRIESECLKILIDPLINNKKLKKLNLGSNILEYLLILVVIMITTGNLINDDGAEVIAELIEKTTSLEDLSLSGKIIEVWLISLCL